MPTETLAHGRLDAPQGGVFSIGDFLVGALKRCVMEARSVVVSRPGLNDLVLVPARGIYFGTLDEWAAVAGEQGIKLQKRPLDPRNEASLVADRRGKEIDELLWTAGGLASRGRLADDLSRLDVFRLDYWPNLTRLPVSFDELRLAALLTRYPTSIAVASGQLRIATSVVNQFVTSAWCAGIASPVNRAIQPEEYKTVKRGGLLNALLEKLRNG